MELAAHGLLGTTRGRGGGLRLLKPAAEIVVGEVVRLSESDFTMVECFDGASNQCRLDGHCRLKGVLDAALQAYLQVLDGATLADLVATQDAQTLHPLKRPLARSPGLPPALPPG